MKKIIAINGSPRRNCNTATLLECALNGAKDAGAETELIHLYGLNFKGCISCFYCKRKDKEHGKCAMKDDLSPVLEKIKTADALILGSPVYFMNMTSGAIAFMERLLFSNYLYSDEIPTVFPKKLPNALIYTMNMTEEHVKQFGIKERFAFHEGAFERFLQYKPEILYACNTYQFSDYSKYESSIFNEAEKAAYREEFFPKQKEEAYNIGKKLVS